MNSRFVSRSCFFLVLLGLLSPGVMAAENGSSYGHVSFIEGRAVVMRADAVQDAAVVNLPLVPGDTVATDGGGRCEMQFDNGTVIRLDKNTRLRIATVQAPALTSRWKITTLHLLQGQLYALPQTYNEEVFQVITPHAAAKLENRTAATIGVDADRGTFFFSDGGKFEVLYGDDPRSLNKARIRPGQAFVIDDTGRIVVSNEKRNLEFIAWNEYVDRHFKELHSGISALPPRLNFEDRLLRYWTMTWSPVYGEWTYDEIFGYVWRPFSESFARFDRPFFDAAYARINGRLYLVPRESWGWVPAHMGTWVWLKRGWTWVPGSYFHTGVLEFFAENGCIFPSFNYYFMFLYGNYDLWNVYRRHGRKAWHEEYCRRFPEREKMPPALDLLERFPDALKKIIQRINRSPIAVTSAWLKPSLEQSGLDARVIRSPMARTRNDFSESPAPVPGAGQSAPSRAGMSAEAKNSAGRDWNPDRRWAAAHGYSIVYSSARNAVLCPELRIGSDRDRLPAGSRPGHPIPAGPFAAPIAPNQQPASGSVGLGTTDANPANGPGQVKAKDDSGN